MKSFKLPKALALGIAAGAAAASVNAVQVTPESYTFNPSAQQGTYMYGDETGTQLTDGLFGVDRIVTAADAYQYVGWKQTPVTINFEFDGLTSIDTVTVSALQAWIGNIVLPDVFVYTSTDGQTWTQVSSLITPESSLNNSKNTDLVLGNLGLMTEHLQLQLHRNNVGPWIFVDEVSFSNNFSQDERIAASVPEGGATVSLLGLGLLGLTTLRRKFAK